MESKANLATAGVSPTRILVGLTDAEEVALSSTALPATPPPFAEFTGPSDFRTFKLETSGLAFVVDGEIQGLSLPAAVPALPSAWPLAAGALLLFGLAAGRSARARG